MSSFSTLTLGDFLAATASKAPTPGGGAVAGVTVALGAALGQMVIEYTLGKKRFAEHAALHQTVISVAGTEALACCAKA